MLHLRPPREDELPALTALCLRSKAVWGYDDAFMAACVDELTLRPAELIATQIRVAEDGDGVVGIAQVNVDDQVAELDRLFIEPDRLRTGAGRVLFDWAVGAARAAGARTLVIVADPGAAPFYRRMGARDAGMAPSDSIPGRVLPRLELDL